MNQVRWMQITTALDSPAIEAMVQAASQLHCEAEPEDVQRLLNLLWHESFFVREAAAWPLAELAGPSVLPQLLEAYQRGFDDGHDNDGFTVALLEIPALYPSEARSAVTGIIATATGPLLGHAEWLLSFCNPPEGSAGNGADV